MSRHVASTWPFLQRAQWLALADEVRPNDPDLAAELVAMGNVHEFALGVASVTIQRPAPPPPPALPPPPPALPPFFDETRADAIVCAVAEFLDVSPKQVRPVIAAALARAVELGCSAEQVARALAPKSPVRVTGQ